MARQRMQNLAKHRRECARKQPVDRLAVRAREGCDLAPCGAETAGTRELEPVIAEVRAIAGEQLVRALPVQYDLDPALVRELHELMHDHRAERMHRLVL